MAAHGRLLSRKYEMLPKRGETVRLNGRGQEMTIDKITPPNTAHCSWLGLEDREYADHPLDELVPVGNGPRFRPNRRT